MEKITHEEGDEEAWACLCGNTPPFAGFYPCDQHGDELEPVIGSGWTGLYVCNGKEKNGSYCGRIIDQDTREVVGRNPHWKPLA